MSVDKELDEYTIRGSEVHVDSVRDAFLKMYGPGEFIHSDANEGAAKVFDGWVRFLKAEAWDEGFVAGVDHAVSKESVFNPYIIKSERAEQYIQDKLQDDKRRLTKAKACE